MDHTKKWGTTAVICESQFGSEQILCHVKGSGHQAEQDAYRIELAEICGGLNILLYLQSMLGKFSGCAMMTCDGKGALMKLFNNTMNISSKGAHFYILSGSNYLSEDELITLSNACFGSIGTS